jgi:type I restriction enzyme S subunit
MSDELPQGWAMARISELCDVPKEKGREGVVPYLEIGNVDTASKGYALTNKPSVKGCRIARKNDVLVSKVRPTRGAITWIREEELQVSSAFTVLRNRGALAERCLWRFLGWNRGYLNHLGENCTGTMYPTTSDEAVVAFEMPLPPLNEQRRIVAKLETLLGKVDASQQRLAKTPVLLKRFRQAVLAAACSGRLTADWREERTTDGTDDADRNTDLPRSWKSVEFGQLMGDGPQNGLYKPASFYGDGTLIVRIDAFYDGTIAAWGDLKRVRLTEKERSQFALRNDDILVNRVNSPKFLGKCALVRKLKEPCVYESNMMRLRLDTSRALADYAILYLQSLPGLVELRKNAKHAVNQSSINQEDVKAAMFNLPPLSEQQEIVRRVEGLFALADQLELRLAKARGQVDQLTPSLLARAFAGKLVPQDPTDEPASALLERIRKEGPRITRMARMGQRKENP